MSSIATVSTSHTSHLDSMYLETLANNQAMSEAGIKNVEINCLDKIAHRIFNDLLYIFYPKYKEFYHEKQVEAFTAQGKAPPAYVSSFLQEGILFLHRYISSPSNIGAILPSSRALVLAMTRKIGEGVTETTPPQRYLDIGAGTGSFSDGIISKMRPQDHLDLVEYDKDLCKLLQRKFQHLPNVQVHNISIFDFSPATQYDAIVTGLPLNNFPSDIVNNALKKYIDLTCPGGSFCYFEYMLLPTIGQIIRRILFRTESIQNCERILAAKSKLQEQLPTEIDSVYLNMTPARAIHCKVV